MEITLAGETIGDGTIKAACKALNVPYSMYHHAQNKMQDSAKALEYCIKRCNLAILRKRYKPEYERFLAMKTRTTDVRDKNYKKLYHKVSFYEGWMGTFGFLDFIYSVGPMPNHKKVNGRNKWTIDRIDNSKGYEPGNCRWATMKTQGRNKSDNKRIVVDGIEMVQSEACEKYGIPQNVYWNRVNCYGWSVEKALKTPIRKRGK